MLIQDTEKWANDLFSNAELGDKRRTKRLGKLAHQMASHTGSSIDKYLGRKRPSFKTSPADLNLFLYDLIRLTDLERIF
jgi:hypothetical protein